jgi:hypothetical protein
VAPDEVDAEPEKLNIQSNPGLAWAVPPLSSMLTDLVIMPGASSDGSIDESVARKDLSPSTMGVVAIG